MKAQDIKELFKQYPIEIHYINNDSTGGYYFVFLPDFGYSACSSTGETIKEATNTLYSVFQIIIEIMLNDNKQLPTPTKLSLFNNKGVNKMEQTVKQYRVVFSDGTSIFPSVPEELASKFLLPQYNPALFGKTVTIVEPVTNPI